jgi:hypothetical protein
MTAEEKLAEYEKAVKQMIHGYNYGCGYYNESSFLAGMFRCFKLAGAKDGEDGWEIQGKNPRSDDRSFV